MDSIKNLSALLGHTASSDSFYMTQELFSKLGSIHVALELFTLDADIQKSNAKFSLIDEIRPLVNEITSALHEYRSYFEASNVTKLQENEVRRLHQWGMTQLQSYIDKLDPFARRAQKDVDDYSDKIGTTDRFTGYRSMLNRGSRDAFRLGLTSSFKDHDSFKGGYNSSVSSVLNNQRIDKNFAERLICSSDTIADKCDERRSLPGDLEEMEKRPKNMMKLDVIKESRTPAEEAGINIVYPGTTEYSDRYIDPVPKKEPSPYVINPQQDFEEQYGRRVAIDPWMIPESEYEYRYKYPNPEADARLPWLKR